MLLGFSIATPAAYDGGVFLWSVLSVCLVTMVRCEF